MSEFLYKLLWHIGFILITVTHFTACSTQPGSIINEAPPIMEEQVQLSPMVLQKDDFSSEWEWRSNDDSDKNKFGSLIEETPSLDNKMIGNVAKGFSGMLNQRQYQVTFIHSVTQWEQPVSLETIDYELETSTHAIGPKLQAEFLDLGQHKKSRCTEANDRGTACEVVIGYDNITSHLKIYAIGRKQTMDIQMIEKITDEVLMVIDKRITKFEEN